MTIPIVLTHKQQKNYQPVDLEFFMNFLLCIALLAICSSFFFKCSRSDVLCCVCFSGQEDAFCCPADVAGQSNQDRVTANANGEDQSSQRRRVGRISRYGPNGGASRVQTSNTNLTPTTQQYTLEQNEANPIIQIAVICFEMLQHLSK